jgi:hypothetical protein
MNMPLRHTQCLHCPHARKPDRLPTSATIASSVALRVRHLTAHLYALGPRPLYEWACEVVGGADPLTRLEAYGRLDADAVHALGADKLPARLTVIRKSSSS